MDPNFEELVRSVEQSLFALGEYRQREKPGVQPPPPEHLLTAWKRIKDALDSSSGLTWQF